MYRLNSALRILLVICTLAFTAAAQTSSGTGTVGGGGTQNQGGAANPLVSDIAGGSQPHENLSTADSILVAGGSQPHNNYLSDLSLNFFVWLWTNGMSLTGF